MSSDKNANELFQRPNKEAKFYDFGQFTYWDEIPSRPGYRACASFGERNGAPRLTFFPKLEKGPKAIAIAMDPVTFYRFLNDFEEVVKGENGKKRHIDNFGKSPDLPENKMPTTRAEMVVRNRLFFGKDENGVCWIGCSQADTTTRVRILPSLWHQFYKEDGTPITEAEASRPQTLQMIDCLRRVYSRWIGRVKEPQPMAEGATQRAATAAAASTVASAFSATSSDEDFLM